MELDHNRKNQTDEVVQQAHVPTYLGRFCTYSFSKFYSNLSFIITLNLLSCKVGKNNKWIGHISSASWATSYIQWLSIKLRVVYSAQVNFEIFLAAIALQGQIWEVCLCPWDVILPENGTSHNPPHLNCVAIFSIVACFSRKQRNLLKMFTYSQQRNVDYLGLKIKFISFVFMH